MPNVAHRRARKDTSAIIYFVSLSLLWLFYFPLLLLTSLRLHQEENATSPCLPNCRAAATDEKTNRRLLHLSCGHQQKANERTSCPDTFYNPVLTRSSEKVARQDESIHAVVSEITQLIGGNDSFPESVWNWFSMKACPTPLFPTFTQGLKTERREKRVE